MKILPLVTVFLLVSMCGPGVVKSAQISQPTKGISSVEHNRMSGRLNLHKARYDKLSAEWQKLKKVKVVLKGKPSLETKQKLDKLVSERVSIEKKFSDYRSNLKKIKLQIDLLNVPLKEAEAEDRLHNKRQEYQTAFENFDQKANQLFNTLSQILKAHKETQSSIVRNML